MPKDCDKCGRKVRVDFLIKGKSYCMDCAGYRLKDDPRYKDGGVKHDIV